MINLAYRKEPGRWWIKLRFDESVLEDEMADDVANVMNGDLDSMFCVNAWTKDGGETKSWFHSWSDALSVYRTELYRMLHPELAEEED